MTTDRQLSANRANSKKSTGPRTVVGRSRSCKNATTHGLTSRHFLLAGESQVEFEDFSALLHQTLQPVGVLEEELVDRIAQLHWRLRRIPNFEASVFYGIAEHHRALLEQAREASKWEISPPTDFQFGVTPSGEKNANIAENNTADDPSLPDYASVVEAAFRSDLMYKVGRYETNLQRQLRVALSDLRDEQELRSRIKGKPGVDDAILADDAVT